MSDIAKKYDIQYELVRRHVNNHKSVILDMPKAGIVPPKFRQEWNEVRFALIMGLRTAWIDEWNAARFRILGVK